MPIEFGPEWRTFLDFANKAPKTFAKILDQAVRYEAEWLAGRVRATIKSGAFTPLKYPRIGHSGTKPLNRSGSLGNIPAAVKIADAHYFIGIKYGDTVDGRDAVQIARVHEFGSTFAVEVTPKMRRFLFGVVFKNLANKTKTAKGQKKWAAALASTGSMMALPTGDDSPSIWILTIHIPPRPFLEPTFAEHMPKSAGRIQAQVLAGITRRTNAALAKKA